MDICSQLDDYVAGRLTAAEARAFEAHANTCANCAKAVARRRAVELAATVIRRNQQMRDGRPAAPLRNTPAPSRAVIPSAPAFDSGPVTTPSETTVDVATSVDPRKATTVEAPLQPRRSGPPRLVIGVLIVLTAGVALLMWSRSEAPDEKPRDTGTTAVREAPTPEPAPTPAPEAPAPPVVATPEVAPSTQTTPAASSATPVAPAAEHAPAPTPTAGADAAKSDTLPLDTDIETLATVATSRRCAAAIEPLRARVAKDRTDARSWSLLTQCYAKRKRWKNTLESYDKVVQYGDAALVESVQPLADAAHAALAPPPEAPSDAPAPEVAPPPPPE